MAIFPKNSARAPAGRDFEPGAIVMYENDGVPILAAVIEFRGGKYNLINDRARLVDLAAERLYALRGKLPAALDSSQQRADYLAALVKKAEAASADIDLAELWAAAGETGRELSCVELFKIYSSKEDIDTFAALRLALLRDRIFFKRKKEAFGARSPEIVEELKTAEKVRGDKMRLLQTARDVFSRRLKGTQDPFPPEIAPILRLLEDMAADSPDLDEKKTKEGKELINVLGEELKLDLLGSLARRAYQLLILVRHFDSLTNLALVRYRPALEFGDAALADAQAIDPQMVLSAKFCGSAVQRVDLTGLPALTIDDDRTRDMDDALSIERRPGGYNLYIHISDVASAIECGSALDREALARGTSIYLADRTVNMLPEILSEDRLSLLHGEERACLTIKIEADSAFNNSDVQIFPSRIKISRRLNYDQANQLLEENDEELVLLHNIAATCEMKRLSQGGMKVHKRDALPLHAGEGKVELEEVDEESPARSLISEMMVLANSYCARYAVQHDIPLIFRMQDQPDADQSPDPALPEGPAKDYAVRINLKKSLSGLAPGSHATLGLSEYCQATSPIRRYADLINQRQILGFLAAGRPRHSYSEMQELLEQCEVNVAVMNLVTRETKRLWLLRYLRDRMRRDPIIRGTVVRTNLKQPLVELDEVFIVTSVKLKTPVRPGEERKLRITGVFPEFDEIRLEEN